MSDFRKIKTVFKCSNDEENIIFGHIYFSYCNFYSLYYRKSLPMTHYTTLCTFWNFFRFNMRCLPWRCRNISVSCYPEISFFSSKNECFERFLKHFSEDFKVLIFSLASGKQHLIYISKAVPNVKNLCCYVRKINK